MSEFILIEDSLHWKEECKDIYCHDGEIVYMEMPPEKCSQCNGEGHTYTKVEAEKPEPTSSKTVSGGILRQGYDAKEWDCYEEQLRWIKELEEALRVEEYKEPTAENSEAYRRAWDEAPDHIRRKVQKDFYDKAQKTKAKYTLSEGKVKEDQ